MLLLISNELDRKCLQAAWAGGRDGLDGYMDVFFSPFVDCLLYENDVFFNLVKIKINKSFLNS